MRLLVCVVLFRQTVVRVSEVEVVDLELSWPRPSCAAQIALVTSVSQHNKSSKGSDPQDQVCPVAVASRWPSSSRSLLEPSASAPDEAGPNTDTLTQVRIEAGKELQESVPVLRLGSAAQLALARHLVASCVARPDGSAKASFAYTSNIPARDTEFNQRRNVWARPHTDRQHPKGSSGSRTPIGGA